MNVILECCGTIYSTSKNELCFDCFKSNNFFKKYTSDKREIKKEIALVCICNNCKHYILKFLWYTKKTSNFFDYDEEKLFKGKKADEILKERIEFYLPYSIPKPKKNDFKLGKQSKKLPWIYGKALDGETQVPRYDNESGNAGRKIYSKVTIRKLNS
ncbi:hypothetical protein IJX73_02860 [bacterium]|nr:hypothetical protein [bacterium]